MRKIASCLLLLCFASTARAADVMVAASAADIQAATEARRVLQYVADHDDAQLSPPAQIAARLASDTAAAGEVLVRVRDLGIDPTNQEIDAALSLIGPDKEWSVLLWEESNPAITCADLDNAVLIAKNFCGRISADAVRAGVKPGVGIRGACDNGAVVRIKCP